MVGLLEPRAGKPVAAKKSSHLVAFGNRLRELREAAGMTQETLGELSGLHRVSINRLESGVTDVTLTTLRQLASALGVSLSVLLGNGDPPPRPKRK